MRHRLLSRGPDRRPPRGAHGHAAFAWVASLGFLAASNGLGACVVAPPADLPPQDERRPTILHESARPPLDQLLREWPADSNFIVPVELGNPPGFFVDAFIDWSRAPQEMPAYYPHAPDVSSADAGVLTVLVPLAVPPAAGATCHRIEILVVNDFAVDKDTQTRLYHTPNAVGGDTAVWFYTPSGGIEGCAVYDAGLSPEASPVADASSDAGLVVPPFDGSTP